MAGPYLLPEDVSEEHASQVLAFINEAASARDIAQGVEIPGELDVGLRIAERIIARREALGGLASLEQLYAVPLVGPERFTEIVTTLSAARPPRVAEASVNLSGLSDLLQRVADLEAALTGGASIGLRVIPDSAWLGQELTLLAELRDAAGKPIVDRALTLVTTWGLLKGRAGLTPVVGNSVVVRTDHLGLARLSLVPAMAEALDPVQAASLANALRALGPPAASPRDQLPALTELARSYRASGNAALRRAVDVLFRSHGEIAASASPTDTLSSWPAIPVTVVAYLTPAANSVQAHPPTTLLSTSQRNWLYPWTWAYRQLLDGESLLLPSLGAVNGDDRSSAGVLSDVFARVGGFLKAQQGLVGQRLGQGFAEQSLNAFLGRELASFPAEERVAVLTGVSTGTRSLSAGSKLIGAFDLNRADVGARIDAGIADVDSRDEVAGLQTQLGALRDSAITQAQLDAFQSTLTADLSAGTQLQLDQFETRFDLALDGKADVTRVNAIDTRVTNLAAGRGTLADDVRSLQTQTAQFNRDIQDLRLTDVRIDGQFASIRSRTDALDRQIADVTVSSGRFSDQITQLERQNVSINRTLGSVSSQVKSVDRDVTDLKRRRR